MSQSLSANYIHVIFHVKTTSVAIQEHHQQDLNAYVVSTIKHMKHTPVQVNGVRDHIHLLLRLNPTVALSFFVEQIKIATSIFLKTLNPEYKDFAWQAGYGAFSVSPDKLDAATQYIAHQQEHHKDKNFSREYLSFLRGYHINYNENYVFAD